MKKIFILIILIIFASSALFAAEQTASVTSLKGNVQYRTGGAEWTAVTEGMKIPVGATISTGFKSEAVLDLGSSEVFVKQLTRMSIREVAEKNSTITTNLNLRLGRIQADVKTSKGLKHNFTIKTPVSTAAVRGTKFNFDGINIKVKEGRVRVSNKNNHYATYKAGESGKSTGSQPPAGGAAGREEGIVVSADTSDILGGSDEPFTARPRSSSGVQYGSVKVSWTYQEAALPE